MPTFRPAGVSSPQVSFKDLFSLILFHVHEWFACMYAWAPRESPEARRGCQLQVLLVNTCVLGIEPSPLEECPVIF